MFFDLKPEFVNGILAVLQESPVPHKIVDPMLKELVRQASDAKIQSLAYPAEPVLERTPTDGCTARVDGMSSAPREFG